MASKNKYARGRNEARMRKAIKHYDSQTDGEATAEIEAGLASTTMEVPTALVPAVRQLIAKRKSNRATRKSSRTQARANKSRTA